MTGARLTVSRRGQRGRGIGCDGDLLSAEFSQPGRRPPIPHHGERACPMSGRHLDQAHADRTIATDDRDGLARLEAGPADQRTVGRGAGVNRGHEGGRVGT